MKIAIQMFCLCILSGLLLQARWAMPFIAMRVSAYEGCSTNVSLYSPRACAPGLLGDGKECKRASLQKSAQQMLRLPLRSELGLVLEALLNG